jgi:hypothetical protein
MHQLIDKDPDAARDVLLAVARSLNPRDTFALVSLGADCLEDLLKADPEAYFPTFESEAMTDERVAIAMSAVWMLMYPPWKARLEALRAETGRPARG